MGMEVSKVKSSVSKTGALCLKGKHNGYTHVQNSNVAFRGNVSNVPKYMKLTFSWIAKYMKEPSEMTNAAIAMIGTGVIAPFAIMCSPKKKCNHQQDEKADKEKKFFQALRQPVSAFLQFAFQVPTTLGIAKGLNYLAHEKRIDFFKDKTFGEIIPSKKYLKSQAKKALNKNASPELKAEWADELKLTEDKEAIKARVKERIRKEYNEVGLNIDETKLEKLASRESRIKDYRVKKMAEARYDKLLEEKIQKLSKRKHDIKDLDLVTEDYQKLARLRYADEFTKLKEKAKLNWFDKFIKLMGFSNKKLSRLDNAEKTLAKKKGLEILKEDVPDIFENEFKKLRNFVENGNAKAQKIFANKIFWISLVTNLFMVAFSCVALNWLHPKFAALVDKIRGKNVEQTPSTEKKVEVKA